MTFDEPRLALVIEDAAGKPQPVLLYSHILTPELRVRCNENRLTLLREGADAEGKPTYVPVVSAPVPPEGGTFLAIVHGRGDQLGLSLVPDAGNRTGGGSMRFFNLCQAPLGLNFPGLRQVIPPGRDYLLLKPDVKPEDYGQGQFLLAEGDEWKVAGGLRWLHLDDIRTLWFVMPDPATKGLVRVRGIEERIRPEPPPAPAAPATNGNGRRNGQAAAR